VERGESSNSPRFKITARVTPHYHYASHLLYAPDYVINAGGVIDIFHQRMDQSSNAAMRKHIEDIGTTLKEIYNRADAEKLATNRVANIIAEERFSLKG